MAVNPGYTRRQELSCTVDDLSTYSGVILYEGEVLYVKLANGKYAVKIGDGETNIATLPYVINYSDVATQATNASNSATAASNSATTASNKALDAEAYAKGTRNGTAVGSSDPAYHNNAKYYAEQAADNAEAAAEEVLNSKAEAVALALAYDDETAYKIGNLLTYLGKQYYCIADAPAGTLPTNTTYFEEKSVADIIEMIKNGSIVTGHSEVADNLTPYSEDSGTTQENPFISQGTGTDNNSVIVTTGVIAKQLEKQGNTVPVMQLAKAMTGANWAFSQATGSFADGVASFTASAQYGECYQNLVDVIAGHKYLIAGWIKTTTATTSVSLNFYGLNISASCKESTGWQYVCAVGTQSQSGQKKIRVIDSRVSDWDAIQSKDVVCFDITSFPASVITDLTSHPEHFSWYYNGSLTYDAGSLQNCNGRYLECGQGRNLFDGTNDFIVVPGKPLYCYGTATITYKDKDGNTIGTESVTNNTFTPPTNCRICGASGSGQITISLYYSPEEGGEGYNQHYDYVAPIRIDTGNETLKAFDKKLPSGVIERNTDKNNDITLLNWIYSDSIGAWFTDSITNFKQENAKAIMSKYTKVELNDFISSTTLLGFAINSTLSRLWVRNGSSSVSPDGTIEYEKSTPTTEQGSEFSEYAPINDYSYMAWFDTDGNLVSIPQGCKLFYPVDYKGALDDLVMYTNGDVKSLAKNESITDTALAERGYLKLTALSGYDATKTQTLKNVEGVFTWVDDE